MECWMHSRAKGEVGGQFALPKAKACGVGVRGCAWGKPGIIVQDRGHFLHLPVSTLSAVHSLSLIGTLHFDVFPCFRDITSSARSLSWSCVSSRVAATLTSHSSSSSTRAASADFGRKEKKNRRRVVVPERGPNYSSFDTCIECMNAPAANLCDSQTSPTRLCASFTTILLAQSRANEAKQATDAGS